MIHAVLLLLRMRAKTNSAFVRRYLHAWLEHAQLSAIRCTASPFTTHQSPNTFCKLDIMTATTVCKLSPSASAFNTMLTAFVGSLINGLSSGPILAFLIGWISWLPVIRILGVGAYQLRLAIRAGTSMSALGIGKDQATNAECLQMESSVTGAAADNQPQNMESQRPTHDAAQNSCVALSTFIAAIEARKRRVLASMDQSVTFLGWLGWVWSALYTPISQTIWVCVRLNTPTPALTMFVHGLSIGVSALGLTFDTKIRYGVALGRKWGPWAFYAFNLWNAGVCLLLGTEVLVLLIYSVVTASNLPIPLVVMYPLLSIMWAVGSLAILPPVNGGTSGKIVFGLLMGAFSGVVVAAPSFVLWQHQKVDKNFGVFIQDDAEVGLGLGDFLACEGVSVWAKFAAIMP
ncbi:hypothetical protein C7974DRAFT_75075 [Boeremia exigua]|uniref:uncharacterized protein n=1 Tax=Boeremia exigua TaxID=749465 RepID=UPI001E8DF0E8|nr:uncharacterized protein C7974DRAFT_75075 [Boeremia exigua]KAH6613030.1 hypothetical protein C7974DRAFT_75075 [Boeremia exigua]